MPKPRRKQESETSVVVLVPQVAKDIAGRTSDQPAGALAIEVPKSGNGPTRVLNVPNQPAEASAGAPKVPEISAIDYDSERPRRPVRPGARRCAAVRLCR